MAEILQLETFSDDRGNLPVIDDVKNTLPFSVKRIFYIYGVDATERGGHRHKQTFQAVICINGRCIVENDNGHKRDRFILDKPDQCLILMPEDWHTMRILNKEAVLVVFASECYESDDYIYEPY